MCVGSQSNHAHNHLFPPMDQTSARALLLTCKHHPVHSILLELFREDVREFARSVPFFSRDVQPLRAPADRCREARGGGRCRGRVSEIAVTQLCAYHQVRRTADLNIEGARLFRTADPDLFRRVFER